MKQLPGSTDRDSGCFVFAAVSVLVGAMTITFCVGSVVWSLAGIDDLGREILSGFLSGSQAEMWLNILLLIVSFTLLIPATGMVIWWPSALVVRSVELVLSFRPHPDWVRLWKSSLEFRDELRKRVPIVHWYTRVMSKFGSDARHPLTAGGNWVRAFLTTGSILTAITIVPYMIDQSWPMPQGIKPLFPLIIVINSPMLVEYFILRRVPRRNDRPPVNRWSVQPPLLDRNDNNHQLPSP